MAELREIHFLNITTPTPPKSQFYYSIYPGIYIRKIADRDLTIRTYFLNIVGYIFGSTFWYVSDCTAILATFNSNNEFYVRSSSSERTINI